MEVAGPVYRIEFSELAARKFRGLDPPIRERVTAKLRDASEDPRRHLTRLRSIEAYRLRVGDYRLVLDVDWEGEILYVLTLGHRRTVYR